MRKNKVVIFAKRPVGLPDSSTFRFEEREIPKLQVGEVLIQTEYLSVDPYMRGRMSAAKSYAEPFQVNEPLVGGIVGKVIESKASNFTVGDYVNARLEWAEYNIAHEDKLRKIDPKLAPITTALYVLGMPGVTAYFGLLDIGKPKKGETVVISGAAGAVGMIVGQIAKLKGCRVVGIAGSDEKAIYLKNKLGYDEVINYKTTENMSEALRTACPNGIDVYFDNVGGAITDAVIFQMNFHARLVVCGQIAHYNDTKVAMGPRFLPYVLTRSILIQGFIVSNYADRTGEAMRELAQWLNEGKISYEENIVEGLENAPEAFLGLFRGDNLGKQIVKL